MPSPFPPQETTLNPISKGRDSWNFKSKYFLVSYSKLTKQKPSKANIWSKVFPNWCNNEHQSKRFKTLKSCLNFNIYLHRLRIKMFLSKILWFQQYVLIVLIQMPFIQIANCFLQNSIWWKNFTRTLQYIQYILTWLYYTSVSSVLLNNKEARPFHF